MQRHRLILLLISLALIVLIYFLPRIVVDNEEDQELQASSEDTQTKSPDDRILPDERSPHSREIDATDRIRIDQMKTRMKEPGNDQLAIADSLSALFISYNQYDSAAKYLEFIAGERPGIEAYENAGTAFYEAMGFALENSKADHLGEKARYYFTEILKEDENRLDIKNKLAMTYITSSNPMQGITLLREVLSADPENESALFNLGILAVQSGQFERAGERFKKLVSLYPQNLQAQFYLGLCYYEIGRKEEARTQFELVQEMGNDPEVLATVEGYLKELK